MSVFSVWIGLLASFDDGRNVAAEHFVDRLRINPSDPIEAVTFDRGRWATSQVVFPIIRLRDYSEAPEPINAFYDALAKNVAAIARWLEGIDRQTIDEFRKNGLRVCCFIDVWMNQDQMELWLPPEFTYACGRLGLEIQVISNDIAASEIIEGTN